MCLHGVSQLQRKWLSRTAAPDVAVYVVWVPQLSATQAHVPEATRLASDQRARHYWDGEQLLGKEYLAMGVSPRSRGPVWDIFFLYDRNAVWHGDSLPRPAYLAQQTPPIDVPAFLSQVDRLMRR